MTILLAAEGDAESKHHSVQEEVGWATGTGGSAVYVAEKQGTFKFASIFEIVLQHIMATLCKNWVL